MATVEEEIFPCRILEESSSSSSNPTDAVIFVGISLVLGICCRHLLRGTRVPYTVALLVLGVALGSLDYGTDHRMGKIGDGIRLWAKIDPDLLLAVFLPALLFESAFSMEVHQIKRCIVQMLLLAGPGVLISTFCLGSALKLIFPYDWSWKTSLLLGGLLSATDPVAVVALLKELGASKKLNTIIEGESLMNDGTAIVVYQLFYRMVLGESMNFGAIVKFLTQVSLGAVGIGLAFGIASVLWLGYIFNDTVIEIALTLAVSYIAYFTAQEGADVSGVLTVMTLGMFYAAVARTAFKGDGQQSLHHFWEMVAYIANTLIFILSGVVIAEGVLSSDNIFESHENSWGYLILLYIFVQVSRIVVVGVLYPFLSYFGYGLDWKEAIILIWSGLRGAVALSLSLSVKGLGMEFFEVILNGIEIVKNIWVCVGECVNYKKILDENVQTLKKKMEALTSREEDINTESRNAKYSGGKQLRKEVETWLKNVQDKISEVKGLEKKASKKRYFLRSRFLRLVEKKTQEVVDLIEEGRFPEGLLIYVHQDQEGILMTTPLVGQSAKETTLMKIWECLMDDGIVKIGVYGMAGVGKTSIVTHIHNQLLESSSFDHVYWVTVSQESNIHKLQGDIARVMRLDLSYEQDARKRATKLFNELKERKKFVLILDDMWKFFPLEDLGIPIGIDAGKLIVTSRLLEVCRGMKCQQNIKVEPLSMEEAWELFMEKFGRETVLDPEVEKLAKSIAKECGGLPLAIITTARSMSGVDDVHEWRNALTELKEPSKGLIDMENEVFKPLKFSYDRLNDEKLQQCLLYCALFPEDYVIHRMDLIVCWIAEGLVDEMKTRQEQFDKGHSLLNKLENACLLERTTDLFGEICIKMHDVIRDMALKITGVNHRFMVKAGVQLTELPEENEWSENLERVSLMHNYMKGNLPSISPKSPKLCTLMLQSNRHIREIPNSFFVHMQSLRVLDLSQLGIGSLPNSISNLETLRALLLHDCQNLEYVPSLANLTELRELDLRRTRIKELPHGVEKLVNLKRLDLFHTEIAYAFPEGVLHILSHLQSLGLLMFKITDDVHVEEIISLKQLEVLVVPFYNLYVFNNYVRTQHWLKLNKYNLQAVRSQVMVSDKVRCREVHVIGCSLIQGVEDPLVLPANIQELRITLCNDLHSLSDISSSLKGARELERCLIEFCEGIQNLWSWSISPLKEDSSKWCANTNTSLLQSLKTLMVQWLPNLSVLFDGVGGAPPKCGTFSNLNLVSIGECPNLKYVFTRALVQYHLKNLEVIHVYHCSEMENIVLEEEEEILEEIVAAKEEEEEVGGSNERTITCPKLQWLELEGLPKLKSIWSGAMVCHSLHQIEVRRCPVLKRLPISDLFTLKKISGSQRWWDVLEWDHPNLKSVFQPLFDAKISSNGYSRRAAELWRQDLRRYEK